jgi:cell division septal protein FtsQ
MRRPRRQRWPSLVGTLAVLVVIGLLVWLLPAFRLSDIAMGDLRTLQPEEVIQASGLQTGQHLFAGFGGSLLQIAQLRYNPVENRLLQAFPVIKTVKASMDFPGRIKLEITERVEVAYIEIPDGCVMIDKAGVAMAILDDAPAGIPVLGGVTVTKLTLGQPLAVDVPSALNSAITLMGAIIDADQDDRTDQLLLPTIRKIMPVGGRAIYLTVILPHTGEELSVAAETGDDQAEDMLWLRFALAQGVFDSRGKGVLDLTGSRKTFTPD